MPKPKQLEIRINTNTIVIDNSEIYQICNIARVQGHELRPDRLRQALRIVGRGFITLVLLVILAVGLTLAQASAASSTTQSILQAGVVVDGGAGGAVVIVALVLLLRAVLRRSSFVLLIEMNGSVLGVVSSFHRATIEQAVGYLADAMENPPTATQTFVLNQVIKGDQFNMTGLGTLIGKMIGR